MDIEQFYDQNPRRRTSDEFEFGRDWRDNDGVRWELSWVQDTGELYAMREPVEPIMVDPLFGDEHLARMPTAIVTVEVLGGVPTLDAVEHLLAGWPEAMRQPQSLQWARDRLERGADRSADDEPISPNERPEELPGAGT